MSRRPRWWWASLGAVLIIAAAACTSGSGALPTSTERDAPAFDRALAARLQEALENAFAESDAPGVQAAVVAADGSVWTGAAGLADVERDLPMTSELLMVPASISKVYTATLILSLVQDGSLSLDDPVERWLPGTPHAHGVLIRQLLNHMSGIASDDPTLPPVCDPGTCRSYSNAGYNLLGRIVEEASGVSYAQVLRERISGPLGLEATFVPAQEAVTGDPSIGYDAAGDGVTAIETLQAGEADQVGSGGIIATASDVASFAHALFTGEILESGMMAELLDFEAARGLPGTSECSAEAAVGRHTGTEGESWFHGGMASFFRAWVEHYPRGEVTVAVMVNDGTFPGSFVEALSSVTLEGASAVEPGLATGRCDYDIAVRSRDGSTSLMTEDARFDTAPSWTAAGGILWSRIRGEWMDVFLETGTGSAWRGLTHGPANEVFARSSPADERILFASNADGDYEIYVMAPDGTHVEQLTRNDWDDLFPAWSPDGDRIAYVDARDGMRILVMDGDGTHAREITGGPGDEWPAWSPDGDRIVYEAGGMLLIVPVGGGEPVRLPIPQVRVASFPSWAPRDTILFESDMDLWSARADGSRLRRLTATSTEERFPAWGPDGSIVYQIGRWVES
jgi:D-alanyl-D-alanine carboxypeptidase